jgi:hypothetical protein
MKRKKSLQTKNAVKIKKWEQVRSFLDAGNHLSDGYYLVVEIVTSNRKNLKYHHLKGYRERIRNIIDKNLHRFDEIKETVR